ncbi:hypothetical protein FisN_15Lh288 [Fistulifera solaris]|uniref:MI domain-containing protein n=1 Tax=Fistulifera solaris TaxID=1519565 RepID=A0A1Z5KFR6_FISSO|nr:hypothetical protein FisN_15Lh288 [Fistulifera solaris]|eukprot:GAX25160.1 hypothetical protein FisN_15Lh288 [Fistulifera solaris]
MGKVHNPTGEGIRAISTEVQAKAAKIIAKTTEPKEGEHETKVVEGTAKRNITRKKTADKDSGNYNSAFKKQGGHGKGQWKELMDPSYAEKDPIDEKDPIYDEAEDSSRYILSSMESDVAEKRGYDPGTSKAVYGPLLTLSEFKLQLTECLHEYYDSADTDEVIRTLEELGCQEYHSEIVKKAVSLALDKSSRSRELTSRLLTCLHPTPMTMSDMTTGFEKLLDSMEDLQTDVPDAATIVASFLARAVVDEVLPPAFMSDQNNNRPGDLVIEKALTLLSREHCTARLEKVWGPGDGRPVEDLKKDMDQLLQEYLLSCELDEAARCVKELEAAHFHHELVKRGVFAAMEKDGMKADGDPDAHSNLDAMAALFGFLVRNAIVSEYQVKKGIDRLHTILPDLTLDVPMAPSLLTTFEDLALQQGCLKSKFTPSAAVEEKKTE